MSTYAAAETPMGGCDWVVLPHRSTDEQDVLISVRGECLSIEMRTVGTASAHQMSAVFVCVNYGIPREFECKLPAQTLTRPVEVRIHGENPQYDLLSWFAEPTQQPPPEVTPPLPVPGEGGALLRWRIPQDPAVRWFEFEYAAVDTSATGNTAPVWQPLDQPDAWTYCATFTPPHGGPLQFGCVRDVPYLGNRYRVRACNWSGPNATAGCGPWKEEPYMACVPLNQLHGQAAVGGGCPCDLFPSPPTGCVP